LAGTLGGLALVAASACEGGPSPAAPSSPPGATRPFAMGLGDFPHARTEAAIDFAVDAIRRDADLAMIHLDDGIPWEEAAAGAPYPREYQADLERRARIAPPGHLRYLAVTPLRSLRDGLADRRGASGSEPLRPPWDRRRFDDPETVEAYLSHCERLIALFRPDTFVYGIEVNMLALSRPEQHEELVALLSRVYERVKAAHPGLPVALTFQVDFLRAFPGPQAAAIRDVMPYTDLVAASTYHYEAQSDPRALPTDFFDPLVALGLGKPFAVAETGWPAEPVTSPYPTFIPASEETQRLYVEWLLGQAERHRAVFVNWILSRDYDDFWPELQGLPNAVLLRLWKDLGLYRGDGTPRPSHTAWRAWLARPRA
jgi:hypothetical protein